MHISQILACPEVSRRAKKNATNILISIQYQQKYLSNYRAGSHMLPSLPPSSQFELSVNPIHLLCPSSCHTHHIGKFEIIAQIPRLVVLILFRRVYCLSLAEHCFRRKQFLSRRFRCSLFLLPSTTRLRTS